MTTSTQPSTAASVETASASARPEKTAFDHAIEALIVSETEETLYKIDRLAREHGVSGVVVSRAIDRFSGPDLADCWDEYVDAED